MRTGAHHTFCHYWLSLCFQGQKPGAHHACALSPPPPPQYISFFPLPCHEQYPWYQSIFFPTREPWLFVWYGGGGGGRNSSFSIEPRISTVLRWCVSRDDRDWLRMRGLTHKCLFIGLRIKGKEKTRKWNSPRLSWHFKPARVILHATRTVTYTYLFS